MAEVRARYAISMDVESIGALREAHGLEG